MRPFDLLRALVFGLVLGSFAPNGFAASDTLGAIHWSGDKTLYDTRANRMDLIGHAAIHQGGESLFADKIVYERDTKIVHATGNAVFVGKSALIQGSEMHFNLETRTGTIIDGRVSTDQFTLSGERINKLGADRYQAHRADYSTCKDCPQSWTLSAADVDLQVDGYAYLSNVTAKVTDAPGFWIPYMIVPIKTKRQSGLLMPQFGFGNEGFTFVQPFFWAISRSFDMTFGAGNFGGRGQRLEWEGRYSLTHGQGTANFYHLNDQTFRDYLSKYTNNTGTFSSSRWGLKVEQTHDLPFGISEKLRIVDVSDSLYLLKVGDLPGNGEAYLTSDLSFSHATDKVSSFVTVKRYRNILTPLTEDPRAFDTKTVQVLPQAEISTNDKVFFDGNLVGGLSLGATNFVRERDFFDRDQATPAAPGDPFRPGTDPIREAVRARVNPSLYTTFRAGDVVSIVPRANYKHYFYDFNGHASALSRGYMNLELDVSTQFERIYDRDPASEFPRFKHLIRPLISYSVIPFSHEQAGHPFIRQLDYARERQFTGYNFDNEDIVPMDSTLNNASYFAPKGNAVSYGFTTQIERKRKLATPEGAPESYTFDMPVEWSVGQSFNLRELRKEPDKQAPLSRFYSLMTASFDRVSGYSDFYYIPYQPISDSTSRFVYSLGANWIISKGVGKVLAFERNFGAAYTFNRSNNQSQTQGIKLTSVFSLNDYIMPGASVTYDMLKSRWQEANTTLTFQSPSECWKLDLSYLQNVCPKLRPEDSGWCGSFKFNLSLNLTGSGFGSISDPKSVVATAPTK